MRKQKLLIILIAMMFSFSVYAQHNLPADLTLDHLRGKWLLTGLIAGKQVKHDVTCDWVLGHEYFQIKETSREMEVNGHPSYEAIVYITYNTTNGQYDCLWLDNTSNAGLSNGIIAHAKKEPDRLALLFQFSKQSYFHTTLTYDPANASWKWLMTSDEKGKVQIFADAEMVRSS